MRIWQLDYGVGTASVDLFDLTAAGYQFNTSDNYWVASSGVYPVPEPDWQYFDGRWDQYEKLKFICVIDLPWPIPDYTYIYKEVGAGPDGRVGRGRQWDLGFIAEEFGWPEERVLPVTLIYLPLIFKNQR